MRSQSPCLVTRWFLTSLVLLGLSLAPALLSEDKPDNPPARLQLDDSPLAAEVRAATSMAPIVQAAAPSVVSVSTTKFVATRGSALYPWQRFFFDQPGQGEQSEPSDPRDRFPVESMGSGVIVTTDGYILTSSHVIEDVDEIKVTLSDAATEYTARVVGKDAQTDIAVLKVEAQDLPAATITDPETLEVGDLVLAIGNPYAVGQTVTSGMVSAKGRSGFFLRYEDFIQTDAPINPGNSGGALVDAQGRVVGICTFIVSRSGGSVGVNFAVPIDLARFVMDKIIADGEVRRGALGVELEAKVSQELAEEFDLPSTEGALVTRVLPSSPADEAGIQAGDFITSFNGEPILDRRSLQFEVAKASPDSEAELVLIREGKSMALSLTLGELESLARNTGQANRGGPIEVLQGVEMTDLTSSLRRQLGIPSEVEGNILVAAVDPDSAAYESGLREGTIILEANREPVESVDDLRRMARGAERGRLLLRVRNPNGLVSYLVITQRDSE